MNFPEWFDSPLRACNGRDTNMFFPPDDESGGRPSRHTLARAVRVCQRCPFKARCLDFALRNDERYGVWGGVSARARLGMARRGVVSC